MAKKHISYSEFRNWKICPYYRHLTYDKRVNVFEGNIYTAFGKALHEVCEKTLTNPEKFSGISQIKNFFKENFTKPISKFKTNIIEFKEEKIKDKNKILRRVENYKYDNDNMRYLYICQYCGQKWKN